MKFITNRSIHCQLDRLEACCRENSIAHRGKIVAFLCFAEILLVSREVLAAIKKLGLGQPLYLSRRVRVSFPVSETPKLTLHLHATAQENSQLHERKLFTATSLRSSHVKSAPMNLFTHLSPPHRDGERLLTSSKRYRHESRSESRSTLRFGA